MSVESSPVTPLFAGNAMAVLVAMVAHSAYHLGAIRQLKDL